MRYFVISILFSLFTLAGSGETLCANILSNFQTEQCLYPKDKASKIYVLTKKQIRHNKPLCLQKSFSPFFYRQNLTFFDDKNLSYCLSKTHFSQFFKMKLLPNSADDEDLPLREKA